MVREFNSVIGKETRKQAIEKWGGMPDVLVASVGSGCNALGLFHEFIDDKRVRMIGVEGGGVGSNTSELHSASLVRGEVGVYHGAMCYLLQDKEGQITKTESVASGRVLLTNDLFVLKDSSSIGTSHAFAYLERFALTLPHGTKVEECGNTLELLNGTMEKRMELSSPSDWSDFQAKRRNEVMK
ncbi:tryptophan synthase beta chain 1-like protein [Tanacetum coccineum]